MEVLGGKKGRTIYVWVGGLMENWVSGGTREIGSSHWRVECRIVGRSVEAHVRSERGWSRENTTHEGDQCSVVPRWENITSLSRDTTSVVKSSYAALYCLDMCFQCE